MTLGKLYQNKGPGIRSKEPSSVILTKTIQFM